MESEISNEGLEYLIHHVVFPPKVPQRRDETADGEAALITSMLVQVEAFQALCPASDSQPWSRMRRTFARCQAIHKNLRLIDVKLTESFQNLQPHDVLVLHIRAQNAGLLVRMTDTDEVIFEAFEASARAEDVISSPGSLVRSFPGCVVSIPAQDFHDQHFQVALSTSLSKMSFEPNNLPKSAEAIPPKTMMWDTAHPGYITLWLRFLLEGLGHRVSPIATIKRTRDDVYWEKVSLPWRRLPLWLVLRVGLQISLTHLFGPDSGKTHYKNFMAYFLAGTCDKAVQAGCFHAEVIAFIRTKLSRRLYKLQETQQLFPHLRVTFESALKVANAVIVKEWAAIQEKTRRVAKPVDPSPDLSCLTLSLVNSGDYLRRILADVPAESQSSEHTFTCAIRNVIGPFGLPTALFNKDGFDLYLALMDFEAWVEQYFEAWGQRTPPTGASCTELAALISQYKRAAVPAYRFHSVKCSLMLLTILELWRVLDEHVLALHPLLVEFSPEVPMDMAYGCLLPDLKDMKRLQKIEAYIERRGEYHLPDEHPSVFSQSGKGCFAESYFDQNEGMKEVHAKIIQEGNQKANAKRAEWRKSDDNYRWYIDEAARISHTSTPIVNKNGERYETHDSNCRKCSLEKHATDIKITVNEFPLPADEVLAISAVFELCCPSAYSSWRDATWLIVNDLGRKFSDLAPPSRKAFISVWEYSGLQAYHSAARSRVDVRSTTPALRIKSLKFPIGEEKVCVPNRLRYDLFDNEGKVWTAEEMNTPTFFHHTIEKLPEDTIYASLQFAVDATTHTSNQILARQFKCPRGLNLLEYSTFQDIRAGKKSQWLKILRELAATNLNFSAEATLILVSHAALQVEEGSGDDPLRLAHWVFRDDTFCQTLVQQLEKRFNSIQANWKETSLMKLLIVLLLRLISLDSTQKTHNDASTLLQRIRAVVFQWMRDLRKNLHMSADPALAQKFSTLALSTALLCRRTFGLEVNDGIAELRPEALKVFVECSIVISNQTPPSKFDRLPVLIRNDIIHDWTIASSLECKVRTSIELNEDSLSDAISAGWPGAHHFGSWATLSSPDERWVTTTTIDIEYDTKLKVHYNILHGTLLVNHCPVGRLPLAITTENLYQKIFGNRILEVFPSNIPGMTHMGKIEFEGHKTHFGRRDGELVIQARKQNKILQLIPHIIFQGDSVIADLPESLISGCVHWLDLDSGVLEIRGLQSPWYSSTSGWYLAVNELTAYRGDKATDLVDVRSKVFEEIAAIIEPFETRSMMVLTRTKACLSLTLPRFNLTFTVNKNGLLESSQLRGIIDENQDIGTFQGLQSKLVLKDATNCNSRSVIVPRGTINLTREMNHARIIISNPLDQKDVQYCTFVINPVLQRLDCRHELKDVYYKAYLQALTSFVLPDSLTGRTGTEEGLCCLQSGFSQPCGPLDVESIEILSCISELTPCRTYHSPHLKVMQEVKWHPYLSAEAQHDDFRTTVETIFKRSESYHRFYFLLKELPMIHHKSDVKLLERAYWRNSSYRKPEWRIPPLKPAEDSIYKGRDGGYERGIDEEIADTDKGDEEVLRAKYSRVFEVACLCKQWSPNIAVTSDLAAVFNNWGSIHGYNLPFPSNLLQDLLQVNLQNYGGSLFGMCQKSSQVDDTYKLMFTFTTIAFSCEPTDMILLRTLLATAFLDGIHTLQVPRWSSYNNFCHGEIPTLPTLKAVIATHEIPYIEILGCKPKSQSKNTAEDYVRQAATSTKNLASHLLKQWPCEKPQRLNFPQSRSLDVEGSIQAILPLWEDWFRNWKLSRHIQEVQTILATCKETNSYTPEPLTGLTEISLPVRSSSLATPVLKDLLRGQGPEITGCPEHLKYYTHDASVMAGRGSYSDVSELRLIVKPFKENTNAVQRRYGNELWESITALENFPSRVHPQAIRVDLAQLRTCTRAHAEAVKYHLCQFTEALLHNERSKWLNLGGLWASITPAALLESLRLGTFVTLSQTMAQAIVTYGERITMLQRSLRIEAAARCQNSVCFEEEVHNKGHENWSPKQHPEWLLLEIESNVLIRPEQYRVAKHMITPPSSGNTVLQLNMGQGKSSVIIPMVAAVLANTRQLLRIIVPKPLLSQMAQILSSRLGGLLGRHLYHIPFSRGTPTDPETIAAYWRLLKNCQACRGIVLTIPEHILSFKLKGLERLSTRRIEEASSMVQVQTWLSKTCRDILDECDHTLAVRTQLIYPSGTQSIVDGHPNRWRTSQAVLHLLKKCLPELQRRSPGQLEVIERHSGGFPWISILRKEGEISLTKLLAKEVCTGRSSISALDNLSTTETGQVMELICNSDCADECASKVMKLLGDDIVAQKDVLLLRGLLAYGILALALRKRWNVQYGLHPTRCLMAVPYHAKGVPSPSAEYGHPDVAIILTCLSYYHSGLSQNQFREVLERLLSLDDPSIEYDQWMSSSINIPAPVDCWQAINLENEVQYQLLFSYLRYTMKTVDFYLNHFVFPREAKEFDTKLVTCAWDLPLAQLDSRGSVDGSHEQCVGSISDQNQSSISQKLHNPLTTGFSGTNDNRSLLPLIIKQGDLPSLLHTNAEVLTYLLDRRNHTYVCAVSKGGKRLSVAELLNLISQQHPVIRVLLDAGAQVLDMPNLDVVKLWLTKTRAPGAVYFNENDKLMVLYRDDRVELLSASPYVENVAECLVYLDEVHTRGTDLKLPANARAALTLGPGQTKDHTVQAAMRLRQLAHGQSVAFFAPPEVNQSILDVIQKSPTDKIASRDVITWMLDQTCRSIESQQPLYTSQGLNFYKRSEAARDHSRYIVDIGQQNSYIEILKEREGRTLAELYTPGASRPCPYPSGNKRKRGSCLNPHVNQLLTVWNKFRDSSTAKQASAHEEQERELAVEVEEERQACSLAFEALARTSLSSHVDSPASIGPQLLATYDFINAVALPSLRRADDYQRPVEWILWSKRIKAAMIISPFEAENLLDIVRDSEFVHLILYAAAVTRKKLKFDTLSFYAMPPLPSDWAAPRQIVRDLGLFAGRLYFNFDEYAPLCAYLRVPAWPSPPHNQEVESASTAMDLDYPESEDPEPSPRMPTPFSINAVALMLSWTSIRRKGVDFTQTPMGYICQSKKLKANHVFFAAVDE